MDRNHAAIREALRSAGWDVEDLSAWGHGAPDLLIAPVSLAMGYQQVLKGRASAYLIEVKDGTKPPSARKLTPKQVRIHALFERIGIPVRVLTRVEQVAEL